MQRPRPRVNITQVPINPTTANREFPVLLARAELRAVVCVSATFDKTTSNNACAPTDDVRRIFAPYAQAGGATISLGRFVADRPFNQRVTANLTTCFTEFRELRLRIIETVVKLYPTRLRRVNASFCSYRFSTQIKRDNTINLR